MSRNFPKTHLDYFITNVFVRRISMRDSGCPWCGMGGYGTRYPDSRTEARSHADDSLSLEYACGRCYRKWWIWYAVDFPISFSRAPPHDRYRVMTSPKHPFEN